MSRPGERAGLPTIVVGGFTSGGDGKTPVALALAALLTDIGERPAFLTRGYGRGRSARREPFLVDLTRDTALDAGDEPMLMAGRAPTIVAVDRAAGARLARDIGATALLLDDGLQSRRLEADFALAVVDGDYGEGNGLCLPAGPLRAPLARQIGAVDAVLAIGAGAAGEAVLDLAKAAGRRVFRARAEPEAAAARRLAGERVLAFAGIARPEKFLATLQGAGARVAGVRWFADHHRYSGREIVALERAARSLGAALVTTEKDAARLPASAARSIIALPIRIVFEEPSAIRALMERASARARLNPGA